MAVFWITEKSLSRDSRVYSSGRLSRAHAVLEKECAACHVQQAGSFSAKAADSACLDCHDGPTHHPSQLFAPNCATCHTEHRGGANLSAVRDQACVSCHADLRSSHSDTRYFAQIEGFERDHPEFAALHSVTGARDGDPAAIKLNHAVHMKPIPRGPNGTLVNLECSNCHRSTAAGADLTYSDAKYRA